MPWKAPAVSEVRLALVHLIEAGGVAVGEAARQFGVSRKTADKWLQLHRRQPDDPLGDRSRRPRRSPLAASDAVERKILQVRVEYGWGARKIHAYLKSKQLRDLPSARTVHQVLRRHGAVDDIDLSPPPKPQCFERSEPHQLWQCDFKGPLEVDRQKVHPFTVLDDHSRYLIALQAGLDLTMRTAFDVLWNAFGEVGLPEAILCDNAFGTTFERPKTLSWFDSRLIRLGIRPVHGRPYHPQTQGKVERLHGTLESEVWPHVRRDCLRHFNADLEHWRVRVYNGVRPHEALGDEPPVTRFRPSPRPRPAKLPEIEYPSGATLRKVGAVGDIRWQGCRIMAGRGIVGELVRIEEREHDLVVSYGKHAVRIISLADLKGSKML
jgi:transposase InsO family protein